jgi:hypothetical protein
MSPSLPEGAEAARASFFFWFFGASGGAGLARSAFPRMFAALRTIRSLRDEGPTLGGSETLGISPFCGYPRDLHVADVERILSNPLTVEEIVEKYPQEGNFLSKAGYLTYDAFVQANEGCNPLTVRAVFDTFKQSTDASEPDVAQQKLDEYRQDVYKVRDALLRSKFQGYFAIFALLFLLGLADVVAADEAYHGWFPDWPGGRNIPASLFEPGGSPWTIPDYWI